MNERKKIEKESGYAVYALLPKKDERYRRRDIKVEPNFKVAPINKMRLGGETWKLGYVGLGDIMLGYGYITKGV